MENSYGIGVKNRYELFYDEDVDPLEIIRRKEEKQKRKADKAQVKDKNKIAPGKAEPTGKKKETCVDNNKPKITVKPDNSSKSRTRPPKDPISKASGYSENTKIETKNNIRNRDEQRKFNSETSAKFPARSATFSQGPQEREQESAFRRGRGGFRGRGRGRGRGGSFGSFDNRPRRDFDHDSGHDRITSREKPDLNWVDAGREDEIHNAGQKDEPVKVEDGAIPENTESKENEPAAEEHKEAREMTLDEYKREQEGKRAVPKYNLRKSGEGEDNNQWKKLYILKKKVQEEEEEEDEEEEDDDEEEFAHRGRQRQLVDIQINFNDSRRGRGRGRGGRGSSRQAFSGRDIPRDGVSQGIGGKNRGGAKATRPGQQSAPRVDDWNDFPSLVTG